MDQSQISLTRVFLFATLLAGCLGGCELSAAGFRGEIRLCAQTLINEAQRLSLPLAKVAELQSGWYRDVAANIRLRNERENGAHWLALLAAHAWNETSPTGRAFIASTVAHHFGLAKKQKWNQDFNALASHISLDLPTKLETEARAVLAALAETARPDSATLASAHRAVAGSTLVQAVNNLFGTRIRTESQRRAEAWLGQVYDENFFQDRALLAADRFRAAGAALREVTTGTKLLADHLEAFQQHPLFSDESRDATEEEATALLAILNMRILLERHPADAEMQIASFCQIVPEAPQTLLSFNEPTANQLATFVEQLLRRKQNAEGPRALLNYIERRARETVDLNLQQLADRIHAHHTTREEREEPSAE